jgi:hypothetical protein
MDDKQLEQLAAEAGPQEMPKPPERITYRPVGHGVEVNGTELHIGFLIPPVKIVQIEVPAEMGVAIIADAIDALKPGMQAEGKKLLLEKLTGIVTP